MENTDTNNYVCKTSDCQQQDDDYNALQNDYNALDLQYDELREAYDKLRQDYLLQGEEMEKLQQDCDIYEEFLTKNNITMAVKKSVVGKESIVKKKKNVNVCISKKEKREALVEEFINAFNNAKATSPLKKKEVETLTNEKLASMSIKEKLHLLASKIRNANGAIYAAWEAGALITVAHAEGKKIANNIVNKRLKKKEELVNILNDLDKESKIAYKQFKYISTKEQNLKNFYLIVESIIDCVKKKKLLNMNITQSNMLLMTAKADNAVVSGAKGGSWIHRLIDEEVSYK
eukprot:g5316.t1